MARFAGVILSMALVTTVGCGTSLQDLLGQSGDTTQEKVQVASAGPLTSVPPPANNGLVSIGVLDVTSGTVSIDTDARTITVGKTVYTGTVETQDNGPEVAQFVFDSINLGADVKVTTAGSRPLGLISLHDATIAATIDASAPAAGGANGAAGKLGGRTGPGAPPRIPGVPPPGTAGVGPGGGQLGRYYECTVGGGGFGGRGGNGADTRLYLSAIPGGVGGASYGDLLTTFEGGSSGAAGGRGLFNYLSGGGGPGGGAIAVLAVGSLTVSGAIVVNGGRGGDAEYTGMVGGGGGSGGGILLHGANLAITGTLSAMGGASGDSITTGGSGGGGGGRIVLHTTQYSPEAVTVTGTINLAGGASTSWWAGQSGQPGVCDLATDTYTVQAAQTLVLSDGQILPGFRLAVADLRVEAGGKVTLNTSGGTAHLGPQTSLNGGIITAANGLALAENQVIQGNGQIRANVDLASGAKINGDKTAKLAVVGNVTGQGTLTNVTVYGQVGPNVTQSTE